MASTRLQTFLFVDMVGFTALTELHGDDTAADLAIRFAERVAAMAVDHGAQLVKTLGDAVMLRAERSSDAVRLGLGIQTAFESAGGFPPVRAGMHTGSAVERAGDWFGAAVNLAARVASTARSGELLMTESSVAAAGALDGVTLESLGAQVFRNVSAPVGVYSARAAARVSHEEPATEHLRLLPSLAPLPATAAG
jgi:adenylate cyclase